MRTRRQKNLPTFSAWPTYKLLKRVAASASFAGRNRFIAPAAALRQPPLGHPQDVAGERAGIAITRKAWVGRNGAIKRLRPTGQPPAIGAGATSSQSRVGGSTSGATLSNTTAC